MVTRTQRMNMTKKLGAKGQTTAGRGSGAIAPKKGDKKVTSAQNGTRAGTAKDGKKVTDGTKEDGENNKDEEPVEENEKKFEPGNHMEVDLVDMLGKLFKMVVL